MRSECRIRRPQDDPHKKQKLEGEKWKQSIAPYIAVSRPEEVKGWILVLKGACLSKGLQERGVTQLTNSAYSRILTPLAIARASTSL